jgi:putative transcriptional regulator
MKVVKLRIKEQLDKRGMQQKELAEITKIRPATINDLYHDRSKQIPREVIEKIANALDIDDINELITIVDE